MSVIFYSAITDEKISKIFRTIEYSSSGTPLEWFVSIESLTERLRKPLDSMAIALLNVSLPEDLVSFIAMKDQLQKFQLILITRGMQEDEVEKLRILRPRFIFSVDDNPNDMGMVFKKMVVRMKGGKSKRYRTK